MNCLGSLILFGKESEKTGQCISSVPLLKIRHNDTEFLISIVCVESRHTQLMKYSTGQCTQSSSQSQMFWVEGNEGGLRGTCCRRTHSHLCPYALCW
jgi:hypothetical protein